VLGLPLILVGGSYLGILSHVLSAQEVIVRHRLELRAIVISESEGAPPLDATLATLANFAKAPLLGLRRQGPAAQNGAVFQRLAKLIA
jgi:dethiobiotin synthetase